MKNQLKTLTKKIKELKKTLPYTVPLAQKIIVKKEIEELTKKIIEYRVIRIVNEFKIAPERLIRFNNK